MIEFYFLFFIYIIILLSFYAMYHSKILIFLFLLKIFDICGPPKYVKKSFKETLRHFFEESTTINNRIFPPNYH